MNALASGEARGPVSRLRVLFVHNNFPGQFLPLIRHLRKSSRIDLSFVSGPNHNRLHGVRLHMYPEIQSKGWPAYHERGVAVSRAVLKIIQAEGQFDIVLTHLPFGDALYLRGVMPRTPIIALPEFYSVHNSLYDFFRDGGHPEAQHFISPAETSGQVNAVIAKGLLDADICIVPTQFQRRQFPRRVQESLQVLHEGIDDALFEETAAEPLVLPNGRTIRRGDPVVSFATRSLEPTRGYDVFLRAAAQVVQDRADTLVLVAGNEGHSYTGHPAGHKTWREKLERERPLPSDRFCFLGLLERSRHVALLRSTSAHVYLTAPFVLSWSLLEAMAVGAPIVGSATEPVKEVISDEVEGLLVDFFDWQGVAAGIKRLLANPALGRQLGEAARAKARDLAADRCVPRWVSVMESLLPREKADLLGRIH